MAVTGTFTVPHGSLLRPNSLNSRLWHSIEKSDLIGDFELRGLGDVREVVAVDGAGGDDDGDVTKPALDADDAQDKRQKWNRQNPRPSMNVHRGNISWMLSG